MSACAALGYMSNEPERVSCALHELRSLLKAPEDATGFGMAHYVDDRLLLTLRPAVTSGSTLEELVGPVRTGMLACNFHAGDDGGPYKYRAWAFAMRGARHTDAMRNTLLAQLPDFLSRNLSGDSVGEAVFHRLLANLHEVHRNLEDADIPPRAIGTALGNMLQTFGDQKVLLMVSNGRMLAGAHNGAGLSYNLREGILACQRCAMDSHALDSFPLRESHRRFRGVMMLGGEGTPAGFMPVPSGQPVIVNRKLDVTLL